MSRDPIQTQRARQLRRQLTPAESILWREVRNRRFTGFKFRRQHPIGPFFADLACRECKLIVELDGETHLGAQSRDEERTKYLQAHGWMVLRFWNTQVYEEREGVMEVIYRACQQRRPPHPQPLSPEAGERGVRQLPPHPQPLSPEAGERGVRQLPPHPQPLSLEAGERGERRTPPLQNC